MLGLIIREARKHDRLMAVCVSVGRLGTEFLQEAFGDLVYAILTQEDLDLEIDPRLLPSLPFTKPRHT